MIQLSTQKSTPESSSEAVGRMPNGAIHLSINRRAFSSATFDNASGGSFFVDKIYIATKQHTTNLCSQICAAVEYSAYGICLVIICSKESPNE